MKTDVQLAKSVAFRLTCCGVLCLFIYIILTYLVALVSTKEVAARVYKITDGQYELIKEETFEDKSEYTPPEGDDLVVEYVRSDSPVWVQIISGVVIQAIMLYQAFKVTAVVLAQPGYRAQKEGKDRWRGFRIGLLAAIPSFCLYVAYVIATALQWQFARPIFCVLNVTFRPLMDIVFAFSDNPYSIWNALAMIVVVAMIPVVSQLAFTYGHRFLEFDFRKFMYKKEKK